MTRTAGAQAAAEQLALVRDRSRRKPAARGAPQPAPADPVARVLVDVSLPHLDRPFDYLVPDRLADQAVPGARVRVRFSGQLVDGFVAERLPSSDRAGRLSWLERVVSPEPVLTPSLVTLARAVADRWGGTLADVLRLAVPPRHAGAEARPIPAPPPGQVTPREGGWQDYPAGPAYLRALAGGGSPRAVWAALPGGDRWPAETAEAVAATVAGGRGALVVVPDRRDVARVDAALAGRLGPGGHVVLTAELGPAERYRRWLAVRRGATHVVVGTRSAAFAPVAGLGLAVCWDDGDDLHAEPRAPYPHVREVLALRAHLEGCGLLIGGHAVTAEGQRLVATGWARPVSAARATVRRAAPRVQPTGDDAQQVRDPLARAARLPGLAFEAARAGLDAGGPVLVQVPRRGYLPGLACERCRAPARCAACRGPIGAGSADAPPACRWCGLPATGWRCPACSGRVLRATVVGARRTAEELGRAFPGVPVRTSGGDAVVDRVPDRRALVIATPGAEPVAEHGYPAVLLLDAWAMLTRPDLRAGEETLRRWLNAAALARPAGEGGRVVVVADSALRPVQALVRWDPFTAADRELGDRVALGFPPATRLAALTGSPEAVGAALAALQPPAGTVVLGPVPVPARPGAPEQVRALLRTPHEYGPGLAAALRAMRAGRSARKDAEPVQVVVDPVAVG